MRSPDVPKSDNNCISLDMVDSREAWFGLIRGAVEQFRTVSSALAKHAKHTYKEEDELITSLSPYLHLLKEGGQNDGDK
jgi:hypothetical protein